MKNYLYVISLASITWAKFFFLLNCKMVCALTVTPHCEKFCVFSHNNLCNPAENLRNTYSASVSQMPPIAINMKLRSIFLRDKFYRYLRTECGTYNLHEVQTHVFYVKSWCEWKEIATGWQQNTQQKEDTGAPFHDQIREFEGKAGCYLQLVHKECSLVA